MGATGKKKRNWKKGKSLEEEDQERMIHSRESEIMRAILCLDSPEISQRQKESSLMSLPPSEAARRCRSATLLRGRGRPSQDRESVSKRAGQRTT